MGSKVHFWRSFEVTHGALDIVILALLSQDQLTTSKSLVVSDQVVIALETFATSVAFKFFSVNIHVSSMHLLVFENQGTLLTSISLASIFDNITCHSHWLYMGCCHCHRLMMLDYRMGLNSVVSLHWEIHHRLSVLQTLGVDCHVPVDAWHLVDGELDVVDEVGEVVVHPDRWLWQVKSQDYDDKILLKSCCGACVGDQDQGLFRLVWCGNTTTWTQQHQPAVAQHSTLTAAEQETLHHRYCMIIQTLYWSLSM